jgi:3-phosphoshikimate 1-carboxyvinyltransferase
MTRSIRPVKSINGEIELPGDKSISHRALMFSAISDGKNKIEGLLEAEDCLCTRDILRTLGVKIEKEASGAYIVEGLGLTGLKESDKILYCGNSGTTMRLMQGLLAGQPLFAVLTGDKYLTRRPMKRVIDPLREMQVQIMGRDGDKYPPIAIKGGNPKAVHYRTPIASAQVKSAILLAGLNAEGSTEVIEPYLSRNHTENFIRYFGVPLSIRGTRVSITGGTRLVSKDLRVPGDISSSAFFLVAAAILPNSSITIRNVGVNPTRTGIINVLMQMGANIEVKELPPAGPEPMADIHISSSNLKGTSIAGLMVPSAIDELPIIAVAAAHAEGKTVVRDAKELRVKESDRLSAICTELKKMGADITENEDGFVIEGKEKLKGASLSTWGDHRMAMAMTVAAMAAEGESSIDEDDSVKTSFPGFFDILEKVKN